LEGGEKEGKRKKEKKEKKEKRKEKKTFLDIRIACEVVISLVRIPRHTRTLTDIKKKQRLKKKTGVKMGKRGGRERGSGERERKRRSEG